MHISQGTVYENGRFRIPIPTVSEGQVIKCNLAGELIENIHILYASDDGTADGIGSAADPLTFQKALELAADGDTVKVQGEIVLPADFVWPSSKKRIIVSGVGDNAALNQYRLQNNVLEIHTDTLFENIEFASTETGKADKLGIIRACGNVVTLEESVTTRGIFGAFYGGARNWDIVDKTETYVCGGNFSRIFGGGGRIKGNCLLTVGGNTNTTAESDPVDERNKNFEPYIYGGTLDNVVEGDCITTITGNAAGRYLYGGSLDDKDYMERGSGVNGKTVVNIEGGRFMNVYGMNPPTDPEAVSDVTINMTGGSVEALIGSSADTLADSIKGCVTINALGGTVTRRIIGGVYNENGWYSDSGKYITGDVNVVIGPEFLGMTDTQAGHGIFGGSRIKTNPAGENAKLIFVCGSYDTFKNDINADSVDCKSHYDYLITGTTGGMIEPGEGNQIVVKPGLGYIACIDGENVLGNYTLNSTGTDIVFTDGGQPPVLTPCISGIGVTADADGVQTSIDYVASDDTNALMLALYENGNLTALERIDVKKGAHIGQKLKIPYVLKDDKNYTLKAFLWSGTGDMIPLCEAKTAEVTVQ